MKKEQDEYLQLALPIYLCLLEAADKDESETREIYRFMRKLEKEFLDTWPPADTLVVRNELPLAALLSPTWRPSSAQVMLIFNEREATVNVSFLITNGQGSSHN